MNGKHQAGMLVFALAIGACDTPGTGGERTASYQVAHRASVAAVAAPALTFDAGALGAPVEVRLPEAPLGVGAGRVVGGRIAPPDGTPEAVARCSGARPWVEAAPKVADLTPPDLEDFDQLGMRVAAAGPWIAAGAAGSDAVPYDAGIVHLWHRAGGVWTPAQRVTAPRPTAGERFGWDVDLDRDRLAVGAPGAEVAERADAGAVDVFGLPTPEGAWRARQRVVAPSPAAGARFGEAVRLTTERMIVGAPGEGDASGAAYLFAASSEDPTLTPLARLVAPTAEPGAEFGFAVAMAQDVAVVGAPGAGDGDGAAWVFVRRGYVFDAGERLVAPELALGARFGGAVGLARGVVLVGADGDAPAGVAEAGVVWVFEHRGGAWRAMTRLAPAEPIAGAHFGATLRYDGAVAAIGAFGAPGVAVDSGAAYLFAPTSKGSWTELGRFIDVAGASGDRFGVGLGLDHGTVAVGAWSHDGAAAVDAGRLVVFGYGACDPATTDVEADAR